MKGQAPPKNFNVFVGNLPFEATWQDVKDSFRTCGDVARVELLTQGGIEGGRSKGCAIVEFRSKADAKRAVQELHDTDLMGRKMLVREDRGGNVQDDSSSYQGTGSSVFVGNIPFEAVWQDIKDHFRSCGEVEHVEVMTEGGVKGGRSKGCAIVVFRAPSSAARAIRELHDTEFRDRRLLVREDTAWSNTGTQDRSAGQGTRVFVANLAWEVTWQQLKDVFRQVGDVSHVEVLTEGGAPGGRSKGCAIVEFHHPAAAKRAIAKLHDVEVAGRPILVRQDEIRTSEYSDTITDYYRVFVANLHFSVTWQDLKDHMREVGEVVYAEVMTEGGVKGGRSKGCGIVQYATYGGAKRAVERLHDSMLKGRAILVRPDVGYDS